MNRAEQAKAFRELHTSGFLLPNVWDAASARIFEAAGFPAVGTTSAGIAHSRGRRDGQTLTREEMCREVQCIVNAVSIPVNADIEAGYGDLPADVARTVTDFLAVGAVGLNLEDATGRPAQPLYDLDDQIHRIEAARQVSSSFYLNARTDTFLLGSGRDNEERLAETIRRGRAYQQAGADSLFVPLLTNPGTIRTLISELGIPVTVMAFPGAPTVPELLRVGAARVSIGQSAMLACLGLTAQIAQELRETGTYHHMQGTFYGFAEAQALFS